MCESAHQESDFRSRRLAIDCHELRWTATALHCVCQKMVENSSSLHQWASSSREVVRSSATKRPAVKTIPLVSP